MRGELGGQFPAVGSGLCGPGRRMRADGEGGVADEATRPCTICGTSMSNTACTNGSGNPGGDLG